MHYHLILTENCNLRCRYCYEKSMKEFDNDLEKKFKFDFCDPEVSSVETAKLKEFLLKDKDAVLVFYGGEPLMQLGKIREIMDSLEDTNVKFRMQTNGVLLHLLEAKYLNKIDKMLVSLDGDKERTDFNRGKGTYNKVMGNIDLIKKNGYKGELVARMTIDQEFSDVKEQVINLVEAGFTSVHWQLDVGFYKEDFDAEKIKKFLDSYNESIKELVEWWMDELRLGRFTRLYPFVGIIDPLLRGVKNCGLRCGAGHSGYAISTSGKVVHCPIMNNIENFKAGDLSSKPCDLKKFDCKDECKDCDVYGLCGGRCMYWRKAGLWPKEGNDMVCDSIRYYIGLLQNALPEIKELIAVKVLDKDVFEFEEYFGPEIIP